MLRRVWKALLWCKTDWIELCECWQRIEGFVFREVADTLNPAWGLRFENLGTFSPGQEMLIRMKCNLLVTSAMVH